MNAPVLGRNHSNCYRVLKAVRVAYSYYILSYFYSVRVSQLKHRQISIRLNLDHGQVISRIIANDFCGVSLFAAVRKLKRYSDLLHAVNYMIVREYLAFLRNYEP